MKYFEKTPISVRYKLLKPQISPYDRVTSWSLANMTCFNKLDDTVFGSMFSPPVTFSVQILAR